MVVEPRPEMEPTNRPEAVKTVQPELELDKNTSSGLRGQQQQEECRPKSEEPVTLRLWVEQQLMSEPVQQFPALAQHETYRKLLEWLGKQVIRVADWMEAERQVWRSELTQT